MVVPSASGATTVLPASVVSVALGTSFGERETEMAPHGPNAHLFRFLTAGMRCPKPWTDFLHCLIRMVSTLMLTHRFWDHNMVWGPTTTNFGRTRNSDAQDDATSHVIADKVRPGGQPGLGHSCL